MKNKKRRIRPYVSPENMRDYRKKRRLMDLEDLFWIGVIFAVIGAMVYYG